ncbi:succinyl-CoA:3-ketoacid coenzyme A transferase subunit B-like [Bactrocera neohumeralis]|uniref:succinyl-CoA:3-ketoacid coenzyme A transferase subunit B-like n=1 Tax=Bactrocera neohumeralis TaxID=98809 RepID=UPI0021657276|nr:succinyl-CoA:3-ketoacid coenzyme A transferase subunit B-like [Bactrocera neohumeralis]
MVKLHSLVSRAKPDSSTGAGALSRQPCTQTLACACVEGGHPWELVFRGTTPTPNYATARAQGVYRGSGGDRRVRYSSSPVRSICLGPCDRIVKPDVIRKEAEFVITRASDEETDEVSRKKYAVPRHRRRSTARPPRRAWKLDGMYLNLGVGVPTIVANYILDSMDVVPQERTYGVVHHDPRWAHGPDHARCLQVLANGDIASWYVPGKVLKGMGGAMDLTASGCKVIVLMEHCSKDGQSRVVNHCTIPLTGLNCVSVLITDLAVFRFEKQAGGVNKMILCEVAEGVTVDEAEGKDGRQV